MPSDKEIRAQIEKFNALARKEKDFLANLKKAQAHADKGRKK